MKVRSFHDKQGYIVRVERGEEIRAALSEVVKTYKLAAASFTGIGAVTDVSMGDYSLETKEYRFQQYDGVYELVSSMGNISWKNDEPLVHMHGVISNSENVCTGGHIDKATVAVTGEFFLRVVRDAGRLERKYDDETGLHLLNI